MPPVTELRSPPDSRMTGADSPVIADSSTLAMPSTTSPSPGITSPATTTTRSPGRSWVAETSSVAPDCVTAGERSSRSWRARRVAACALPRPRRRPRRGWRTPRSARARPRPTRRRCWGRRRRHGREHGADLDDEHDRVADHHARVELAQRRPGSEVSSIRGSSRPPATRCGAVRGDRGGERGHQRPSARGPSARTGKKVRPATMTATPVSMPTNSGPCVGSVPAGLRHLLLARPASRPGRARR